jgi:DNA polymerase I-like protein with 3'-5' exonuclease and polymerase domains
MQNLLEMACDIHESLAKEPFVFLLWDPNDPESTTRVNLYIKLRLKGIYGLDREFNINLENALSTLKLLEKLLNDRKTIIFGYNFKNLYSFFARVTGCNINLKNVFDLYWYESYLKIPSSTGSLDNAIINFKKWSKDKFVLNVYKSVYLPLITEVLPSVESYALRNDNSFTKVYCNYEVEGQENGRLSCNTSKKNTFNPHNMNSDKEHIKFVSFYRYFLQFDYNNMETSVLAHLSNDEKLISIVTNSKDVYGNIFEEITGVVSENSRLFGKKMFLPLIYGQTASSLSKILDISSDQAENYILKARGLFAKSFAYVEKHMNDAKTNNFDMDVFGRKRFFDDGEHYKARNFCIQSPSSLICLYYLIKLYKESGDLFKIIFHVHDGYFLGTTRDSLQECFKKAKNVLESENPFIPDLRLKVSAKLGISLDRMVELTRKTERRNE